MYRKLTQDNLIKLREQYNMAKKLNIVDGLLLTQIQGNVAGLPFRSSDMPAYMRGTKVLEVELEHLEKRANKDAYIPGLRDLEERKKTLASKVIDESNLSTVTVDEHAVEGLSQKISPRGTLSMILGAVFGIGLGLLTALGFEAIERSKFANKPNS